jgi:hypothetical protein
MNIFPTDIQYFLLKYFKNKKEIIKLYMDPDYKNEELIGYYYPEKIIQEKIKLTKYLFKDVAKYGNIRLMKWLFDNKCPWSGWTFRNAAGHGNLDNMKWLKENGCHWNQNTFTWAVKMAIWKT